MLTFSAARWRMLNETSGPVNPEAIPAPSHPDPRWALSLSESGREAIRTASPWRGIVAGDAFGDYRF